MDLNRRVIWRALTTVVVGAGLLVGAIGVSSTAKVKAASLPAEPLILDMVHHNPGGARDESNLEEPSFLSDAGYKGKVHFLFDSPTPAINRESVDPDVLPAGSPERAWADAKASNFDRLLAQNQAAGLRTYAQLPINHPNCASRYEAQGARFGTGDGLEKVVAEFRRIAETKHRMAAVQ